MSVEPPPPHQPNPPVPIPFSTMFRPSSVTAAGIILYIGAGLALIGICVLLASRSGPYNDPDQSFIIAAIIYAVSAVGNAVLAYFIMRGKRWAQVVTIVFCAIGVVSALVSFFGGSSNITGCISVIFNGVIIGLLWSPNAQEYFAGR